MFTGSEPSNFATMHHATLTTLRDRHPAWRLLASPHAPLVASFLHRVFVAPNVRFMSEADLAEALEEACPDVPFTWLSTHAGDDFVFLLTREQLAG